MMANDLLQQAITAYKKGQRDLARDLLLQFVEDDKNNELSWLILADLVKDPADQIIALENALTINPNTYLVEQLNFTNALGEESRFTFTQVKLEVPLGREFFTFRPPPGVQVVRETPGS